MLNVLIVVGILFFLIVTHELGHFLAAKFFGIRVNEFGVGYPPRAYLLGKFRETEYTLNWIPFGGFVKLFGEEEESHHGKGSFIDAPRYQQAIVLLAGVFMNALSAWLLFSGALTYGIPRLVTTPTVGIVTHLIISDVVPSSPAAAAGLTAGDEVLKMTDEGGVSPKSLTSEGVIAYVKDRGGKAITITYVHEHATSSLTMRPANAVVPEAAGRPALGIGLALVTSEGEALWPALFDSIALTKQAGMMVAESLGTLVSETLAGTLNLKDLVGPVGLVSVVGTAAHNGWGDVLSLAGFIAINLAIVNLIPIPALDGGRLVIVIIEAITRRDAPKLAVQILNTIGIALIMMLMIVVTYHDIMRLFV